MTRLDKLGVAWRDYLYANSRGRHNDVEGFLDRMSAVQEAKEHLLEAMYAVKHDIAAVQACRKAVEAQLGEMGGIVQEFVEYLLEKHGPVGQSRASLVCAIMDDLRHGGRLYRIASEWQTQGDELKQIWGRFCKGEHGLEELHDIFGKVFLDETATYKKQQQRGQGIGRAQPISPPKRR